MFSREISVKCLKIIIELGCFDFCIQLTVEVVVCYEYGYIETSIGHHHIVFFKKFQHARVPHNFYICNSSSVTFGNETNVTLGSDDDKISLCDDSYTWSKETTWLQDNHASHN